MTGFTVRSGGLAIAGRDYAAADPQAPTVVLVHGYPDSSAVWQPLVAALGPSFRVVTYDVRGAGASETPRDVAGYEMEHLLGDLAAVLDHVSPDAPVHLVGHDWGAIQGFEAVTRRALAPRLASFTAVSAPGFDIAGRWARRRLFAPGPRALADLLAQGRRSWYVAAFQLPAVPERLWRTLAGRWGRLLARLEGVAEHPGFPAPTLPSDALNGLNLYRANLGRVLSPDDAPIRVPTQIVSGERDAFVAPRLFADLPPEVERTFLPDAGHWLPRTHPAELARLIARHVERAGRGPRRLTPRRTRYDWTETSLPWIPGEPYASHAIDALSLLLPAGERWFVRVFKGAARLLDTDPTTSAHADLTLAADVRGFMGQEAAHAVAHAALLKEHFARRGIDTEPFTRRVEQLFHTLDDRRLPAPLERRWLEGRVAVIASIEHFTALLGQWIHDAKALDAAGADPEMLRLLRWHGAEEVEHADVAFALYHRLYGKDSARGALGKRLARLELATIHVAVVTPLFIGLILGGAAFLMRADPSVPRQAPRGLAAFRSAAARGLLPRLWQGVVRPALAFLDPGFHPFAHVDREAAARYLAEVAPGRDRRHG